MKRKNIIIILLCLVFLLSVTGCSSKKKASDKYGYYTREDGKRIWYEKK